MLANFRSKYQIFNENCVDMFIYFCSQYIMCIKKFMFDAKSSIFSTLTDLV